jgi:long-chain acyl-CoA synthetase
VWKLHEFDWPPAAPRPPADLPPVPIGRDDVAEIIFTSGATADPKGVVITHRNVLANIVPVEREVLKYRKWGTPFFPLRFLNLLPLSHMFGQAMATFIPPMLPGRGRVHARLQPGRDRRADREGGGSRCSSRCRRSSTSSRSTSRARSRPSLPRRWPAFVTGRRAHVARRWWRYRKVHRAFGMKFWAFIVGAAPLEGALEAFWGELGFVVIQGYGLTETAPIVTLNHPFGTKKGSVGKAIAGVEMKIAPDGEILVRGENVTRGYFNASEETAQAFEDGWFRTGDIGEIGEDRQLYIRGRKEGNDRHARGAERVPGGRGARGQTRSPAFARRRSSACPSGRRNASTRSSCSRRAACHRRGNVARQANAVLDDHQKIRRVVVWPESELPRTEGTGKLKRAAIRDWVKSGGTAPHPVAAGGDALAALVARYAGRTDLSPQTTLEELGLSSLERVELMVALEDAFQTRIDEGSFSEARDMGQLRALVERASSTGRAARRTGRLSSLEPVVVGARVPPRAPPGVGAPDDARLRVAAHRGPRAPEGRRRPGDLRLEPPELHGRSGDHGGAAAAMALQARAGDGEGDVRRPLLPGGARAPGVVHQQPELLPRGAVLQRLPLPQREAGARQTLRYIGELLAGGISVLIFPEAGGP